jgi:hypothetical protein
MNITNEQECTDRWQEDLRETIADPSIPEDDKARVLQELDCLYNELRDYLISRGEIPCA